MRRIVSTRSNGHRRRDGFTLIELLVTISIIAILAGLLMGGIQAARSAVDNAKATQEISSLTSALAQFHSEFGQYPPSSITLYETGTDWSVSANVRNKSLIQKLWPDFSFTADRNLNGDSDTTDTFVLDGRECLVFFLGGMMKEGAPSGFSKNPLNPFGTSGSNRIGPFHEFVVTRFIDDDGDDINEYVDTYSGQQTPILYLSSYDGRGYRTSESSSHLSNGAYKQGSATGTAWKSKTYQLISPGIDGEYGTGGWYSEDGGGAISNEDKDNITNFSSGKLD